MNNKLRVRVQTFIPDRFVPPSFEMSPKASVSSPPLNAPSANMNMNPLLNSLSTEQLELYTNHLRTSASTYNTVNDTFLSTNPYSLRHQTMEEYRGQLYQKLSHNIGLIKNSNTGVDREALKLTFFTNPSSLRETPNSSILSGKLPKDLSRPVSPTANENLTPVSINEAVHITNVVKTTLMSKMFNAFMEGFTGSSTSVQSGQALIDPKKVSDVLSGRSRIEVVPSTNGNKREEGLEYSLQRLSLGSTGLKESEEKEISPSCISSILFGPSRKTSPPPSP